MNSRTVASTIIGYVVLGVAAAMLWGCGYAFEGSGSVLPADVKRVYIPRVENNSTKTFLTSVLTEALQERFERYGVLTVVDNLGEADALLHARVNSVKRETRSVTTGTDTALQYDLVINSSAELRRVSGGVLWRESGMRVARSFGTTGAGVVTSSADFAGGSLGSGDLGALDDREVSRGQEQESLIDLAEELAKKIYAQAVAPDF